MKVLIAEDEQLAAERLTNLLRDCEPSVEIAEQLDCVQDVVEYFRSGQTVDLLLLDIQLADGKSFEVFDKVTIDKPIIFTTAYDQYAIRAFRHFSIDYLLKPIRKTDLNRALQKYKKLNGQQPEIKLEEVRELLNQKEHVYKERFLIRYGNRLQYKTISEVAYFFADGKMTYLVTKSSNRKYIVDHTLEELESLLNPIDFFRISRKIILHIDMVKEIRAVGNTRMEISINQVADHSFIVSRQRILDFKSWLNR